MGLPDYTTQLPGERQVVELGFEQIVWAYDQPPGVQPRRFFSGGRGYQTKVEPAPCYGHDLGLVRELLERCHERAPLCAPVSVNVLRLVDARGSNGWAQQQWDYRCHTPAACQCEVKIVRNGEEATRQRNWDGVIVLSGRTTEIHPAIARYVVPHEYAHIVEDALGLIRHDGVGDPGREVVREWAQVRGVAEEAFELVYGTTTHHLIPGEVFANDFRFMLGFETEWWPHREVVPPLGERGTMAALDWWHEALDELQRCYREATAALAAGASA